MQIHGLQKTTLLDYPGKVAATVFFGGCNFRCPFCHNMNLLRVTIILIYKQKKRTRPYHPEGQHGLVLLTKLKNIF